MTFIISRKTAMNVVDTIKKKDMQIHILKNYIKELHSLLDDNKVLYADIRKKYLFQYSYTNNEVTTEEQKRNLAYLQRVSRSNTL